LNRAVLNMVLLAMRFIVDACRGLLRAAQGFNEHPASRLRVGMVCG
jgi:hypothetical protein